MANIFAGTEVEPSAFEIALQQIYLSGLTKRFAEIGNISEAVDRTLGFKRDESGNLVELTEQEQFDVLSPVEQTNFNLLKQQVSRLETAFAGDLPVSERLKQRGVEQFDILKEELARRGQPLAGTDLETGVGFTTPAIQSLGERQRTQGLLESEEQRAEIDRGFANVFQGTGILSDLEQRRLQNLTAAPSRFDVGGGGGLLASAGQQSLFNAQQQATSGQGLADLVASLGGQLLGPSITKGAGLLASLIP